MSLAAPLASPIFSGSGSSSQVPGRFDVAINGHNFMLDKKALADGQMRRRSIALLKPQQDTGKFAETSLNPEEFARRAAESWHHGAGQSRLDRSDSDEARFRTSKGVDPWTRWTLSLLPDTESKRSSSNTNLQLLVAGSYVYLADGNEVYSTTDMTSWGSRDVHDGDVAQSVKSLTTDGSTVYAALGSNGVHSGAAGSDFAHYSDLACTLVAFVKGRLMAANGTAIYNVIASGAAPSALLTLGTGFTWVGFAEGPAAIYAAGYRGDKSLVYRTAVKADGTALDVPVVAGELPDGEIVRSIQGYLGLLLVGTDKGVRVFELDTNGNLAGGGRIIPTDAAVLCFEPQDRFVWYGLTNYDTVSTGLGRLDLSVFTDTLTPAYASDLMATAQGAVLSVVTFGDLRVFAVSASGVYAQSSDLVAFGLLDNGPVAYGIPDTKVARYLDIRFDELTGSVAVALSTDSEDFVTLDTATIEGSTVLVTAAGQPRGETFEVRLTLARDSGDATAGPTVTRWTLEAKAAPGRGEFFLVPLLLKNTVADRNGNDKDMDVKAEYAALLSMETLGNPVTYQDDMGTHTVTIEDHDWMVERYPSEGTFTVQLQRARARS